MGNRQSRFVYVDASVHIHARRKDLRPGSEAEQAHPPTVNDWFVKYLGEKGAFVLEHESRHVHQLMAYPALYLRAIREYRLALDCLADFRDRGDIEFDPTGQHRIMLNPSEPEVQFLTQNYQIMMAPYLASSTKAGQLVWGDDPILSELERTWEISESSLLEAEALVVQYRVAVRRGFDGTFRSWATASGANPTAVNDIVSVLCGTRDRDPVERTMLTMIPALVWHAFHTSWPTTAFFKLLETLSRLGNLADLQAIDADMAFAIVGSMRSEPPFLEACPPLDHDGALVVFDDVMPTNEPFVQFNEDAITWRALTEASPDYPLADAISFRLVEGQWPGPLDFVDPSPEMMQRMQVGYPATAYILSVAPGESEGEPGFYRRWVPRTPWRHSDPIEFAGRLTLLEIAQTLMANVYVGVVPPTARYSGEVKHTCWHLACPVHSTGLCRFWDAIPAKHEDCEFLQVMPAVLNHVVDSNISPPKLRVVRSEGDLMLDKLVVTVDEDGEQEFLNELAEELQNAQDVDPRELQYVAPTVPGQGGEPITIAIIIFLAKAAGAGAAGTVGKKVADGIWTRLSKWHNSHAKSAKYVVRDSDGGERRLTWEQLKRDYGFQESE